MKFTIIHPPIQKDKLIFPAGLGYVAASLLQEDHEVDILDIKANQMNEEETIRAIEKIDADAIGIGTVITGYSYVKWLCNKIKNIHPESKIVIGGPINVVHNLLFEKTNADIVVFGEGEITMRELADAFDGKCSLDSVNGIAYKDNSGIHLNEIRSRIKNLDEVPFPAWELFDMEKYTKTVVWTSRGRKMASIITGRGCPFQCTFCSTGLGKQVTFRSVENIIEEISLLKKKYDMEYLAIFDDNFLAYDKIKHGFIQDFCDSFGNNFQNLKWGCSGRIDLITKELLQSMKKAGCEAISYGAESGSQKMLNSINKCQTVEQIANAVRITREVGMEFYASFMFGPIGENKETIRETVEFCKKMDIPQRFFFITTPLPGTKLYEQAKEMGKITDDETYIEQKLCEMEKHGGMDHLSMNMSELSDAELIHERDNAIKEITRHYMKKHFFEILRRKVHTLSSYHKQHGMKKSAKLVWNSVKNKEFV